MRLRAPRAALVVPLLGIALAAILAACGGLAPGSTLPETVQGEGAVTSEDRTDGDFTHLSVSGGIRVKVAEGPATAVTLSAQANLLPLISTETTGGQLIVNVAGAGFSTSEPVTLDVVVPALESLTLSGGANGGLETTAGTLVLDVSGGAVLEAAGAVDTLTLTVSSGAQANLADLVAATATVTASDGSQATMTVEDELTGDVTAGATVRLTRPPTTVDVTTSVGGIVIGG